MRKTPRHQSRRTVRKISNPAAAQQTRGQAIGNPRRLKSTKQPSAKAPAMHRTLNHMASPASTNIPSNPTRGNAKWVTLKARAPPLTANIANKRMALRVLWLGGKLIMELIAEPYHDRITEGALSSPEAAANQRQHRVVRHTNQIGWPRAALRHRAGEGVRVGGCRQRHGLHAVNERYPTANLRRLAVIQSAPWIARTPRPIIWTVIGPRARSRYSALPSQSSDSARLSATTRNGGKRHNCNS